MVCVVLVFVAEVESVSVRVKLEVPSAVGVPLTTPVAGFSDRPAGRDELALQEYGGTPECPVRLDVYDEPSKASLRNHPVIENGGLNVAVICAVSPFAWIRKTEVYVPAAL